MTAPLLGPVLTLTPSLAALRGALSAMRAETIRLRPSWGLAGGWTDAARRETLGMVPAPILCPTAGDPSTTGGQLAYPYANQVVREVEPWATHRPDLVIEIGNEPLCGPFPLDPWQWQYHLGAAIDALRARWPRARLLAPAFSLNALHTRDLPRWLDILAAQMRRCDGIALHAYTEAELAQGLSLVRRYVGTLPVWLTEVNAAGEMGAQERARRIWRMAQDAGAVAACVYHLDATQAAPLAVQGPASYRLDADTLAALGLRGEAPVGGVSPASPDAAPIPPPPRPLVTSLPMTRERLSRGRPLGPPRVLVMHATAGSYPGDLNWLKQGGGNPPYAPVSCHYYIDKPGRIWQLVADHDTAWHTGAASWIVDGKRVDGSYQGAARLNWLSIGIELANRNDGKDTYPATQVSAAVTLARHLVRTYSIPRNQLVRHLDISPGRKTDPRGLAWDDFVKRVYL